MSRSRGIGIVPSLLLAGGIIVSTIVVALLRDSSWLVLSGPALMALTLVGAAAMSPEAQGLRRSTLRVAVILGASLIVAGVILIVKDAGLLLLMMPVLGAGAAGGLVAVSSGETNEADT